MYVFTLNQSDSERKYAATIYKNGIYLTRFLSEIDHLVYFQFQIQHESSIEDLNSGCSPVCELRVPGQPILNSALWLSSNYSDRLMILQRQNKILRSSVTNFSFGAVKLPLNLRNISLFPILSLTRNPVRESPLLCIGLLRLTD